MILECYITDNERRLLFDFLKARTDVHVLGFDPGDLEGLDDASIEYNPLRFISLWPLEQVRTQLIDTDAGKVEVYDTTVTPLISWDVPFQKRNLIVSGKFRLEEWPDMSPGGLSREMFLQSRKLLQEIKALFQENFVKINNSLFNGPEAMSLMKNGYEGVPFDPDKTSFETIEID